MIKGLLILVVTLIVLLALDYFSIRVFILPKHKRERLRRISLIVYAAFLVFFGIRNLIVEGSILLGWGHSVLGVALFFADLFDRKRKNL